MFASPHKLENVLCKYRASGYCCSLPTSGTKKTPQSLSPESVFLFLPEVKIPLDNGPDVLGLLVCQLGQVQLLAHGASRQDGESEAHSGL